ncbi:hypothetical protein [Nonomuraea sp. NPDC001023]|uniref:hypothetical protein n=1 Tax=unclassified Nonomuraea TaxID=2593643 RepID=UPI00331E9EC8
MAGLEPEPWPGLDDTDAELYYNVGKMRAIADDLEIALAGTQGAGGNRDGVTGSVETLTRYFALGEEHIGRWPAASALAHSVGSTGADSGGQGSMEGRGALLTALYQDYVECCQKLVKAIRDSADSYAKTNPGRE